MTDFPATTKATAKGLKPLQPHKASNANRHSVPMRNPLDLLFYFVNDIPPDFPLALHRHHAHRSARLHQQISLDTPFAAFGCGAAVRSRRQHMRS